MARSATTPRSGSSIGPPSKIRPPSTKPSAKWACSAHCACSRMPRLSPQAGPRILVTAKTGTGGSYSPPCPVCRRSPGTGRHRFACPHAPAARVDAVLSRARSTNSRSAGEQEIARRLSQALRRRVCAWTGGTSPPTARSVTRACSACDTPTSRSTDERSSRAAGQRRSWPGGRARSPVPPLRRGGRADRALSPATEHALASLLALNGLRVPRQIQVDLEDLHLECGHRRPTLLRQDGTTATIPMATRATRVVDLATSERASGPIYPGEDGRRLDCRATCVGSTCIAVAAR